MIGNFNIRDNDWDLLYLYHSIHTNILHEIADSLNLELSMLINLVLTWYTDNPQDSNSVIDLMFLYADLEKFNNYHIILELCSSFDHALISVSVTIKEEHI